MAQVIITINHREYAISCENGEEAHIMKLGRLLDEKATALTQSLGYINENQLLAMVGLLIADELADLKKSIAQNTSVQPNVTESSIQPQPNSPIPNSLTEEELNQADDAIAKQINSLGEIIKSVALKLKSI